MTLTQSLSSVLALCFIAGCANKPMINSENLDSSQVEISYVLGHTHYKYMAVAGKHNAEVSSLRDDRVLEKKSIPLARYQDFAGKVEKMLQSSATPAPDESCRTPYKIQVTAGKKVRTGSGCRTSDVEGKVGRLIKEGEFLLYSEEKL
ncbi:hypothetical protein D3C87_125850 [compost metagenome]